MPIEIAGFLLGVAIFLSALFGTLLAVMPPTMGPGKQQDKERFTGKSLVGLACFMAFCSGAIYHTHQRVVDEVTTVTPVIVSEVETALIEGKLVNLNEYMERRIGDGVIEVTTYKPSWAMGTVWKPRRTLRVINDADVEHQIVLDEPTP